MAYSAKNLLGHAEWRRKVDEEALLAALSLSRSWDEKLRVANRAKPVSRSPEPIAIRFDNWKSTRDNVRIKIKAARERRRGWENQEVLFISILQDRRFTAQIEPTNRQKHGIRLQ
jgi:hypothetical protein